MLSLEKAPGVQVHERFESDRESLPFPRGGVHGHTGTEPPADADSTQNGAAARPAYADRILRTIDRMQCGLDTLERALGEELQRELHTLGDVIARIGDGPIDDWPPAAA